MMVISAVITASALAIAALMLFVYGISLFASRKYDGDFGQAIAQVFGICAIGIAAVLGWAAYLLFVLSRP
jgi:hypothetical protein